MHLDSLGWRSHFELQLHKHPGCTPARVSLSHRDHFLVWTSDGEVEATVSGRLRDLQGLWPATGDWVALRPGNAIETVLERQTVLERKQPGRTSREQVLAANLDVLFIVSGLDHDFNPRRLERYLILSQNGGIRPVLVLNKADLHDNPASVVREARGLASGVPVILMSAAEGWGLEELSDFIEPAGTAALAGSSGVGKSTIVNRLLGASRQATQEVRDHDSRGRHTTITRELLFMPQGWLLIDMPGIRELQLPGGADTIEALFDDIQAAAAGCRFRDCRHESEPGCAVLSQITPARLAAYRKLQREAAHAHRQSDLAAAAIEKQKWKAIHKAMRKAK